jgi:hypothetical protein
MEESAVAMCEKEQLGIRICRTVVSTVKKTGRYTGQTGQFIEVLKI